MKYQKIEKIALKLMILLIISFQYIINVKIVNAVLMIIY